MWEGWEAEGEVGSSESITCFRERGDGMSYWGLETCGDRGLVNDT